MKIALINENSQAAKNGIIEGALRRAVEPLGHEVVNFGMYSAEDEHQLTYVQIGILAAVLLNGGIVEDALDAYTFAQINDGNAIAVPFAKGFGWGGDLNLGYIFEKLFSEPGGQGYPRERAIPEKRNKRILDEVRGRAFRDLSDILPELDGELVRGALAGEKFREAFSACRDARLKETVLHILAGK